MELHGSRISARENARTPVRGTGHAHVRGYRRCPDGPTTDLRELDAQTNRLGHVLHGLILLLLIIVSMPAHAQVGNVISIDFVGSDVPMASTEIAGVVAKPNWNNASGASSSAPLAGR